MAQVIVDEVMLREPNLLIPRMTPNGRVNVDWGNKLAEGHVDTFLPSQLISVSGILNLERTGNIQTHGSRNGRVWEGFYQASNHYIKVPRVTNRTDMTSEITLEALITVKAFQTTVSPYISGIYSMYQSNGTGATAYPGPFLRFNDDGTSGHAAYPTFGIDQSGTVYQVTGTALSANTLYHIIGTYKSGQMQLFVNGVQVATRTDRTGAFTNHASNFGSLLSDYVVAGTAQNRCFNGVLHYARIWNKWCNAAKVVELYRDPHQFLIPA